MTGRHWCIVGGGMLGMTLAHRLLAAGHRVTIKEASATLGGLADAWTVGDVTWDRHYHVTLLSDRHLRDLLAELGLDDALRWSTTRTVFFTDGRLHPLDNAIDFLRFPPIGMIGKLRLAATILHAARIEDGTTLEHIPLEDWLVRLSGRQVFERIWRPLLRAKLGENHKRASAAFIWAVIRRLYAARRSGLKTEMFGYVDGGYARIVERFEERLTAAGAVIERRCPVERVEPSPAGPVVTSPRARERFDEIVLTVPTPVASRLCPVLPADTRQRLDGVLYQGLVCPSLVLRRPLSGAYLTYIADPRVPFTAVVEMSALVDRDRFGGATLAYLPCYVAADDPLFAATDAEIESRFIEGLRLIHPDLTPEDVVAFRVSRVREVVAVPTLGYSERLPPMATGLRGVHLVTSAQIVNGTLNVNDTVALADDAARRLLAADPAAQASRGFAA